MAASNRPIIGAEEIASDIIWTIMLNAQHHHGFDFRRHVPRAAHGSPA
jgi:hypothetical protein